MMELKAKKYTQTLFSARVWTGNYEIFVEYANPEQTRKYRREITFLLHDEEGQIRKKKESPDEYNGV